MRVLGIICQWGIMMIKPILKHAALKKLKRLQYPSGLFGASKTGVKTGYEKAWIRDNIYEALGLESVRDIESVKKAYAALFNILLRHEYKIDWAIRKKPSHKHEYIHARFCPFTLNEFNEDWGNKQNDAVGGFLFKVADLMDKGITVIRDKNDLRILQKLVFYLESIEYWHDKDNGMWEENEEVHASSVGACVAGLARISRYVTVPEELIRKGEKALNAMLPGESGTKNVDLSLLSLIYPYDIVSEKHKMQILRNVEKHLVRERGVIRYTGDQYYNSNGEAEWCFGFPWLAKIYKDLGDMRRYAYYMKKTHRIVNSKMELPELYFADSGRHNENSPLGWAHAMYLAAVA